MRTPKIWDRVSPGNLARVSNLWLGHADLNLLTNIGGHAAIEVINRVSSQLQQTSHKLHPHNRRQF